VTADTFVAARIPINYRRYQRFAAASGDDTRSAYTDVRMAGTLAFTAMIAREARRFVSRHPASAKDMTAIASLSSSTLVSGRVDTNLYFASAYASLMILA
jgi:hypothetical protein